MKRFVFVGLHYLLHVQVIEAAQGSSAFYQSSISLIGIGVFTILIGILLVYACRIDVKHWKKSIDGKLQLEYPTASLTEFQLPPIHRTPETLTTPLEQETTKTVESTQIERIPEEKTLRIVTAMYNASNRDVPESLQKSFKSKTGNLHRSQTSQRIATTLHVISERDDEQETSKKSTR